MKTIEKTIISSRNYLEICNFGTSKRTLYLTLEEIKVEFDCRYRYKPKSQPTKGKRGYNLSSQGLLYLYNFCRIKS